MRNRPRHPDAYKHMHPNDRFDDRYSPEPMSGCWIWTAWASHDGYGRMYGHGKTVMASRFSYERFKGPIPQGYEVDHLCKNPPCVNPDHLEAVTARENWRRSSAVTRINSTARFCKDGHEFTPENTKIESTGSRRCLTCKLAYDRQYRAAHPRKRTIH